MADGVEDIANFGRRFDPGSLADIDPRKASTKRGARRRPKMLIFRCD
jgi:hypothetical protein